LARRALNAATDVKSNQDDKELMNDVAALTRKMKLNDDDITAISDAGIEVIENTAEMEQHQEEINNALMTLNEGDRDGNSAYDLSQDDNLLAALQELETEQQQQNEPHPASPAKNATARKQQQQPDPNNDDDNVTFENVSLDSQSFPPLAASALVYSGEQTAASATRIPPKRAATAETIDGRFQEPEGAYSQARARSTTSNKAADTLNFF